MGHWIVRRLNEPSIDATKHLGKKQLKEAFLPEVREQEGRVCYIVQRLEDGSRKTPTTALFCSEKGLVGDRWFLDPKRKVVEQIAIMDWHIANVIANGQSLTLFGDNLFIDCSFAHVRSGMRFSLGEAILEITPEPHTGCSKFAKRFGAAALRYTCIDPRLNIRGVYARVVQSGTISVHDQLDWLER